MKSLFIKLATVIFFAVQVVARAGVQEKQYFEEIQSSFCPENSKDVQPSRKFDEKSVAQDGVGDIHTHYDILVRTQHHGFMLREFVQDLMSLANLTTFDIAEFETQREFLKKRLRQIQLLVSSEDNCKSVMSNYRFATHFFYAMNKCLELSKRVTPLDVRAGRLADGSRPIFEISEINVLALAMCNSDGTVSRLRLVSINDLTTLRRRLKFWKEEFKDLAGVSVTERLTYERQVYLTSNILEALKNFVQ